MKLSGCFSFSAFVISNPLRRLCTSAASVCIETKRGGDKDYLEREKDRKTVWQKSLKLLRVRHSNSY